jgi:hypothetical protein
MKKLFLLLLLVVSCALPKELLMVRPNPPKKAAPSWDSTALAFAENVGGKAARSLLEGVIRENVRWVNPTTGECGEVIRLWGDAVNTKEAPRNFKRQVYLQLHQTDYWPGENGSSIKTNLYISSNSVYEIHPPETVIKGNYDDLYHLEVAWVSASRTTVVEHGRVFHREAGEWTLEREKLLETALCYAVVQLRAHGVEPVIVTHRQTYWARPLDPDLDIAQASVRIAQKYGFRVNFERTRPSGQSAALWYPTKKKPSFLFLAVAILGHWVGAIVLWA